jgi:anti-sigma B factor antagonist
MRLAVREIGDVTVLYPTGIYVGGPETEELDRKLDKLIEGGARKLLVNLGQTTYVSSAPLAVLVAALNKCLAREIPLRLCCLNQKMNLVLVITKLSGYFQTFESEESALESLYEGGTMGAKGRRSSERRSSVT